MVAFLTFQLCLLYLFACAAETAIGDTGGGGRGVGGNNSIDTILFYDFHQSSLKSNNLRDMIVSYDSINR